MKLSEARILFVDDEPFLLEIFAQWISGESAYQVTTAADGQEALERLVTNDYDLLITDVNMPRIDGPELVRRMTVIRKTPPSVLFISGFGDVDQREMYGLGVEAFLAKPVLRKSLLATMQRALAERAELWHTPFDVPPRHSLQIHAVDVSGSMAGGYIGLGRGGFCAPYLKPIALGKVNFDCHLSARGLNLSGEGYVRWNSKSEGSIGIEIAYLDSSSRAVVLDEVNKRCPNAFIPSR